MVATRTRVSFFRKMASCKVESRLTIEKLPKMVTTLTQKVDFLLSAMEELRQEK